VFSDDAVTLASRRTAPSEVRSLVVGVERYGLKVNELAREFQKTPNGMSQALARAIRRRAVGREFLKQVNRLDSELAD